MDPILVTGGTGTLGRHVVRQLRSADHEVRVLTRKSDQAEPGVQFHMGDLISGDGVDAAVAGVASIIHCAGGRKGDETATRNLVRAAASSGSPHLVYVSVVGVDRIPVESAVDRMMFGYFEMKRNAEKVVAESGLPWSTLRARGADLTVTRIELDAPKVWLQPFLNWWSQRPAGDGRLPTLSDGLLVERGHVEGGDWSVRELGVDLPRFAPGERVRGAVRGRYRAQAFEAPFDLRVAMTRPAAGAGIGIAGTASPQAGDWRLSNRLVLSTRLDTAGPGTPGMQLQRLRLSSASRYESGDTAQAFALGLAAEGSFANGALSLEPAALALRLRETRGFELDAVARVTGRLMVFQSMMLPGNAELSDTARPRGIHERQDFLHPGWPKMAFVEHEFAGDATNWWVPNYAAVEALLRSSGFRVTSRPGVEIYICEPAPGSGVWGTPRGAAEFAAASGRGVVSAGPIIGAPASLSTEQG